MLSLWRKIRATGRVAEPPPQPPPAPCPEALKLGYRVGLVLELLRLTAPE